MCGKISLKYLYTLLLMIIGLWLFPSMEVEAKTYVVNGITYDTDDATKYSNKYATSYYFEDNKTLLVTAFGTKVYGESYYPWYKLDDFDTVYFTANVTEIGSHAFYNKANIIKIELPVNLTSIGSYAFYNCCSWTGELIFPDSIKTIEAGAFKQCSGLTGSLILPDSITSLGNYCFEECSGFDGQLHLPSSVTTIPAFCFENCRNLSGELQLPDTLTKIDMNAFCNCTNLSGTLSLPNKLEVLDCAAFCNCTNLVGDITIPDSITTISGGAFWDCSGFDGKLTLPSSLKCIGDSAFKGCTKLTGELNFSDNLETIYTSAFEGCEGLTGCLKFPNSLTYIGNSAFKDCTSIVGDLILPDSVTTIYDSAFENCIGLDGKLQLPSSITKIPTACFKNCSNLKGNLVIPETVTNIYPEAFYNCRNLGPTLDLNMTCDDPKYLLFNSASRGPFHEMYNITKIIGCSNAFNDNHVCTSLNKLYKPSLFTLTEYGIATECIGIYPYATKSNMWKCNRLPITVDFIVDDTVVKTHEVFSYDEYQTIGLPESVPEKDGYIFKGWYYKTRNGLQKFTSDTVISRYNANPTSGSDYSYYVTAEFIEDKTGTECVVTFADEMDGTMVVYGSVSVPYASCVQPIDDPIHTDSDTYKFSEWLLDGKSFDFSEIITEDITLYASWETYKYYSLDFYTGEEWDSYNGDYQGTLTFKENEYPSSLEIMPRIGYQLSPWYCRYYPGDVPTELFDFKKYLTGDDFVYAQWEECNHTVSFNTNTVTEIPSQTVLCNDVCVKPTENLEKEGHTLLGWYTDTGELYDFNTPVTEDITLTALWSVNKHTVTFSDNLTGYAYLKSVDWGTTVTAPEPPVRNGYTLVGWYADEAGTVPFDFQTPITQDITVYAKWEKDASTYTVTYMDSEGNILDTLSVTPGTILTEPINPEKDGHIFKGWFSDNILYDFHQPVTSNLILMQKWDSVLHTVSFNSEGGSIIPNQTIIYGGVAVEPVSPTKEGYDFKGWYLGTTLYDFNNPVKQDINLTAKWEKIKTYYNVVIIKDVNVDSESFSIEEGYTVPTQETPTKEGYEFKGWFVNNNPYNFNDPVTSNLVIVARWEKVKVNYTVDFVVDEQIKESVVVEEGTTIQPPAEPTKDKHIFKGWFLGDSKYDFGVPVYSDMTLIARWEKIKENYTVNFVVDGEVTSTISVEEGSTVSEPTEPTKDNHTFKGWFLGSAKYDFSTPVTQNITLTAQWEKLQEKCTVKFVSDNKVLSTVTVEKNNTVKEPKTPTKTGYTFKGWFLSNAKYNFSTPVTQNITITAQWEENAIYHKVHFSDGTGTNTVKVKDGDKVTEPTQPAKSGFTFKGWCGDAAGKTDNYNFDKEVTSDLWLYARWEDNSKPIATTPTPKPQPTPTPKPEPTEPESKVPSKPEPETKSKESEPETKQSPVSKLKDLKQESIEVTETIIEPETESESVEEELFTTEEILEEETEYSSAVAVEPNIPVTLKENKKHHSWLWLILLLLILVLLPLILLLTMRRVKVFVQVSTDNEDEAEFQQIYKTFVETKDKAYQVNIPSRVTQDCFSDTFKVLLTEHFVKKHAEEELYVNIAINDEQFSNLFILEEGVVELLFSTHEDTFLQASLDNSEGVTNPPFSE